MLGQIVSVTSSVLYYLTIGVLIFLSVFLYAQVSERMRWLTSSSLLDDINTHPNEDVNDGGDHEREGDDDDDDNDNGGFFDGWPIFDIVVLALWAAHIAIVFAQAHAEGVSDIFQLVLMSLQTSFYMLCLGLGMLFRE
ncbi:MAG: hypothetical protein M1821_000125 [Bathelium mastoideum]|nr:MAG: hypothetical protein M1821_000125 [Bathelium mastoideum]